MTRFIDVLSTNDDIISVVTEEALNSKIFAAYRPILNEKIEDYHYQNGSHSDDIYVEWSDINIKLFQYQHAYLKLEPNQQQIIITINGLSIYTNIWDVNVKYGLLDCNAEAQLLINNWNFSLNLNLDSTDNGNNITNDDMVDFEDCQIGISIDNKSVRVENNGDAQPFDYKFSNLICDIAFNEEYITNALNEYLLWLLQIRLPYNLAKDLNKH